MSEDRNMNFQLLRVPTDLPLPTNYKFNLIGIVYEISQVNLKFGTNASVIVSKEKSLKVQSFSKLVPLYWRGKTQNGG